MFSSKQRAQLPGARARGGDWGADDLCWPGRSDGVTGKRLILCNALAGGPIFEYSSIVRDEGLCCRLAFLTLAL